MSSCVVLSVISILSENGGFQRTSCSSSSASKLGKAVSESYQMLKLGFGERQ
jgi:hypothetical protein